MKRLEELITVGVTAYLLGNQLGPEQNWTDVLNDFRQGRRDFGCAPLLPVAKAKRGRRVAGPMYRPRDVGAFIEAVRTLAKTAKPYAYESRKFLVDDGDPGTYWFLRVAVPAAAAAAIASP